LFMISSLMARSAGCCFLMVMVAELISEEVLILLFVSFAFLVDFGVFLFSFAVVFEVLV
jgi:hypothetical protein